MLRATAALMLPTTITGSLPRPSWYTENLGKRAFLDAMVTSRFREQYVDALSVYLREQEVAGLDIVTDGDCRFDQDIGGQSWTSYPPHHMSGFETLHPKLAKAGAGGIGFPRGHILPDYLEARVMPKLVGAGGSRRDAIRGDLQGRAAADHQAGEVRHRDAGTGGVRGPGRAPQGHPRAHLGHQRSVQPGAARPGRCRLPGDPDGRAADPPAGGPRLRGQGDQPRVQVEGVQQHREGREKTEVWCHTCWGNPSQQRMFGSVQSYKPALDILNQVDALKSSNMMDLVEVGQAITTMKVAIGAIDHHTLQVEAPTEVADLVRQALKHIPAERLVLSSDCGMGREGMSRRHAFYKMVALVQGTNIVRKELGLPTAECLGADPKYSLIRS